MVIDDAAEELPVIEQLLEKLKDAQMRHLERKFKNVCDAEERMSKRIEHARQLLKQEMQNHAQSGDPQGWDTVFATILDALNTDE